MKSAVKYSKGQKDKDPKQVTELDYSDKLLDCIRTLNFTCYIIYIHLVFQATN